jgi:hypothetical protein
MAERNRARRQGDRATGKRGDREDREDREERGWI